MLVLEGGSRAVKMSMLYAVAATKTTPAVSHTSLTRSWHPKWTLVGLGAILIKLCDRYDINIY